jgi:hypothetical protein
MKRHNLATTLLLPILTALSPLASHAAVFNIADGDVAGLIAAIQTANTNGDASNVINLAPNGMYLLTAVAETSGDYGTPGPAGLPYIKCQLTIHGNGSTIQRSADTSTPAFTILAGVNANLSMNEVTLTGGYNDVGNTSGGGHAAGGLALVGSTALIQSSTITQNFSSGPNANAGGLYNFFSYVTILNSTISYNTSNGGFGGGGINQDTCCATYIAFSTLFENQNSWGRGDSISLAQRDPQTVVIKNSILASPTRGVGGVCWAAPGLVISGGYNIAGDASCGFSGPGDLNSTNPLLGPTANSGGPTPTDLPAAGSPAIDGVPLSYCSDTSGNPVTTDQRGIARPQGSACDIGSVEVVQGPKYQTCLLYDSTRAVNGGAVDPIKLQLCDASGNDLSSSAITLHATSVTQISTSISGAVQDAGNANPDNDFRFDTTLGTTGGYIFNLSTKGLSTGTYALHFLVTGDTFVYTAPFQVK